MLQPIWGKSADNRRPRLLAFGLLGESAARVRTPERAAAVQARRVRWHLFQESVSFFAESPVSGHAASKKRWKYIRCRTVPANIARVSSGRERGRRIPTAPPDTRSKSPRSKAMP